MRSLDEIEEDIAMVQLAILSVKTKAEEEKREEELFELYRERDLHGLTPHEKSVVSSVELAEVMSNLERAVFLKQTLSDNDKEVFRACRPILEKMWQMEFERLDMVSCPTCGKFNKHD